MSILPEFVPSRPYSIGVEAEFQLIDRNSYNLRQVAPEILAQVPLHYKERIKPEFIQPMVEVATGVCNNMGEVEADLRESIELLSDLADQSSCLVFASSLHPFADYREQKLTPGERYAQIMEELQIAGRRLITQGLHVHIGMPDTETLIRVCDGIRPYLPLLLALTTSSPYYGGEDTGFSSYRSRLLDALTRSGLPYTFRSWNNFNKLVTDLHNAGLITNVRDIWWDVRPHPDLGTVEVRICDLPATFAEILSIVALIQALVKTLAELPAANTFPRLEIIANNKWQAARYGLEGRFIDLENIPKPLTIKKAIENTINFASQSFQSLGTEKHIPIVQSIIEKGTGTDTLKQAIQAGATFESCIQEVQADFWG